MTKKQTWALGVAFVTLQAILYYFMLFGNGVSGGDLHGNTSRYTLVVLSFLFALCFIDVKKPTALINAGHKGARLHFA